MPQKLPDKLVDDAVTAVENAKAVRKYHARRTERNSAQRTRDIELALERLKLAMAPLRSEIGRFPYGPQTTVAERNREKIRKLSSALQRERRKLWKMQDRKAIA